MLALVDWPREQHGVRIYGRIRSAVAVALACGLLVLPGCRRQQKIEAPSVAREKPKLRLEHVAHVPMKTAREVAFENGRAFIAQNLLGMTSIDVSEPATPKMARTFPPDFVQPLHLTSTGNKRLTIADRFRGLVLLDVQNPDAPTSLSQVALPGIATHVTLFQQSSGWFAAVACGGSGLSIVDITDVTSPSLVGRFNFDTDYSRRVAYLDRTVFVADNFDGGMKLVDVTNPHNPQFLLKVGIRGFYDSVTVADRTLYVGCRHYGTRLFHYPQRGAPTEVLTSPTLTHITSIFRSKDRVRDVVRCDETRMLVANDLGGVDLYDVSDETMPVLLDEWRYDAGGGAAMSIGIYDGYIYVPSWDAGLHVLKVTQSKI